MRWNHLARVRPPLGVEHPTQLAHGVERSVAKNSLHVSHLVETDAVLSGDASTSRDARVHDLAHRLVHALALGGIVGAVGNIGVEVAVASVKDVADENAILLADRVDTLENFRQARPGNDGVLYDQVWSQTAHRTERFLPALPQLEPLDVVACNLDVSCAPLETDALHFRHIRVDSSLEPVELDEQYRFRVARISRRIDRVLYHTDRWAVHELERRGYDSGRDDGRRDARGVIDGKKIREQRPHRLRTRSQLDGDVERQPEAAFRADERAAQIVAVALTSVAAELDHVAAREHHRHGQNVVQRHTVLETVRPTCIFSDVPADGARRITGWIGSVEETVWCDVLVEPQVHDAGLYLRAPVLDVHSDDLFEPVQTHDDDVVRKRSAGEAGSGATRYEGEFFGGESSYNCDGLVACGREHRELWLPPVSR